jgi:hypothetical protein
MIMIPAQVETFVSDSFFTLVSRLIRFSPIRHS